LKEEKRMHLFVLGVVFGVGLMLAYEEITTQLWLLKETKRKNAEDEALALLDHNMDILNDARDWDSYQIQTVPDSPCGCHASWTEHYAGWDYTCKCHHTKAEHDLATKYQELRDSTPDTVWWKQQS
jgi:hypothetical protein